MELIFANQDGVELGRAQRAFSTSAAIGGTAAANTPPRIDPAHAQAPYLDLLENTLLGLPYTEGLQTLERREGHHWPETAHSMIGAARMRHLRACVETVLREQVPGDLMETGVWRGGACILMRGVLKAFGDNARTVWVADSFAGLPPPDEQKYPADRGDNLHEFKELAIPMEQVQANFRQYGLLDPQVRFLKGWFSETLPHAGVSQIAVLRLDGDMYESTMDALTHLYPKLSPGGYCIIDDYGAIPACRQAVRDYRAAQGINEPITMIDWTGGFWRKKGSIPEVADTALASAVQPETYGEAPPHALSQVSAALADVRVGHANGAWTEHIPFAFWLVEHLRPRVIVELGVHMGGSLCAFCQGVEQSHVDARCYGIDTFEGDEHAGRYASSVLAQLRAYHDPRYGSFSTIIQSTFADALSRFEDGSIDLLHIDGQHYYEDVKEDFEAWLPKLSRRAVVLFHDTQVRERGFGVYKFWAEVEHRHPSLEFFHGHGLGVLAVGQDIPPAVSGMLAANDSRKGLARQLFSNLGSRVGLRMEMDALRPMVETVPTLISLKDSLIAQQRHAQQAFAKLAERFEKRSAESAILVEKLEKSRIESLIMQQEQMVLRSQLLSLRRTPITATSRGALQHAWQHVRYRMLSRLPFLKKKPLRARQLLIEESGLFDAEYYRSQLPPGSAPDQPALHYLLVGWSSGLSPHREFDAPWYIHTYQEQLNGSEPLTDYLKKGWKKGRRPNARFDPEWYRDNYMKTKSKKAQPFRHYLETGMAQGFKPCADVPRGAAKVAAP
jgi:predicted O-methyltransferase YrrM